MSRSDAFRQLRRAVRLALQSDRSGVLPRETVERVGESPRAHRKHYDRRRFLGGIAAGVVTTALAPLTFTVPRARAVPRGPGAGAIGGAGMAGRACADALAARSVTATIFEGSARAGEKVYPGVSASCPATDRV